MLFFFEETVAVTGVVPASVPEMGGTVLTISGSNFVQSFPSARLSYWQRPSVAATWISEELLTCIAPRSSNMLGFEVVEVTTNGIDYTDDEVMLEYRRAITVSAVSPTSGPRRGGTLLEISGEGFRSTDSLTCRFGRSPSLQSCFLTTRRYSAGPRPRATEPRLLFLYRLVWREKMLQPRVRLRFQWPITMTCGSSTTATKMSCASFHRTVLWWGYAAHHLRFKLSRHVGAILPIWKYGRFACRASTLQFTE